MVPNCLQNFQKIKKIMQCGDHIGITIRNAFQISTQSIGLVIRETGYENVNNSRTQTLLAWKTQDPPQDMENV